MAAGRASTQALIALHEGSLFVLFFSLRFAHQTRLTLVNILILTQFIKELLVKLLFPQFSNAEENKLFFKKLKI